MSMNVAVIFAIIGLITLVLTIFGASWLNQRATERLLDQGQRATERLLEQLEIRLESKFDVRFDMLQTEFRAEIKRLDQRLDSVENRLDRIERQLEAIFKPTLPPQES